MAQALAGLKVVECADLVAGPYCAKLLADLGAEVIKVEAPAGDQARRRGPFPGDIPHPEKSGLFLYNNTNKRGVTLNLEAAAGRGLFERLVAEADVLVEDKPDGVMRRLGLDYAHLRALNPGLVMTSITPFGQTGPYSGYKAYHLNVYHAGSEGYVIPGGLSWELYPDRQPLQAGGWVAEYDAGLAGGIATLVALHGRDLEGTGQQVDVSKQDVEICLNRNYVTAYAYAGIVETRGTRSYSSAGMLQCQDGYVFIHGGEDHFWSQLMDFMGHPGWSEDSRLATRAGRNEQWGEVKHHVREWAMQHTLQELYDGCRARGIPVGIYASAEDVARAPQMRARGFIVEMEHKEAGALRYPSAGYRLSATPWAVLRPAPLLGEHNVDVFCGRFGVSRPDLVRLRQAGAI